METRRIVICMIGSMVGAGFSSGREIVSFFTRYGRFSWALIGLATVSIIFLVQRIMRRSRAGAMRLFPGGGMAGRLLLLALLLSTAGGMAAAAGEIASLTIPVSKARFLGMAATTALCYCLSLRPFRSLQVLGWLLMPALLLGVTLCLRSTASLSLPSNAWPDWRRCLIGIGMALGYAGMNVTLSAQVLCEAGSRCREGACCRAAAWTGGILGCLLLLWNSAFMPQLSTLQNAALPMVQLLRNYGKPGFYLASVLLYLAIVTTLIAVLRALDALLAPWLPRLRGWAICLCAIGVGLCGFEEIVARAYPFLGLLCWGCLSWPAEKRKKK